MNDQPITAVIGFPRCGTSLMMRMLHAGGMDVVCDNHASYEDPRALRLPDDYAWLLEARGKAVKILEPLTFTPPNLTGYRYNFIWMRRAPKQQALSQLKLLRLIHGNLIDGTDWRTISRSIAHDTKRAIPLLDSYLDSKLLIVDFEDVIERPERECMRVAAFLDRPLAIGSMQNQVVKRGTDCYRGMLEITLHSL